MTGAEKRKITVVAVGAGNRMNAYAGYAELHPDEMCVVGVVEPNEIRREQLADRCGIVPDRCYGSWEEFLEQDKMADAVFLCTPDDIHYRPAMLALERGYDILLEKPIAQSWEECSSLCDKAVRLGRIVGVCHVLRYNPYFMKIRDLVTAGTLGHLMSVNHVEAVGIERMTHAFVRGLWRKECETNPIILSKTCHDLDLLVWLTGKRCRKVCSYGALSWFRAENAPEGSTSRCTDGCRVEATCPYSALDLYHRRRRWLRHFDMPAGADEDDVIMHELRTGPYGRCVYRCDNDVADHQVVSMLMEDDITVSFSMDPFTKESGRKTHLMFSEGEVFGDERTLTVRYFHPDSLDEIFDFTEVSGECTYHGGADLNIVGDFLKAVSSRDGESLAVNIKSSLESHRIAFEIERFRKENS